MGFIGEPEISYEDFVSCHNRHHRGLMKDCIEDEKSAYAVSIQEAQALLKEGRCATEKNTLQDTIKYWESIKDSAPNCKR